MQPKDLVHFLITLIVISTLSCCVAQTTDLSIPANHASATDDLDAEFRQSVLTDSTEATALATRSRSGVNLSNLTVGWYAYGVLTQLASFDQGLNEHFGGDVMTYLKVQFPTDSSARVDEIEHLAGCTGWAVPIRPAAHWTLELLRHIPDSRDPLDVQALNRGKLAATFDSLATALQEVAWRN
jgi:hypothetical protein